MVLITDNTFLARQELRMLEAEFLREVYLETGFRFKVLSGEEEAFYSYYGAQNYMRGTKNIVYFDLGGGSLEILYSENANIKKAMSIPIGTLRITQVSKLKRT